MRRTSRAHAAAAIAYSLLVALFILFFFYVAAFESTSVYSSRHLHQFTSLKECPAELIEDPSAPAGIRKAYTWTLEHDRTRDDSLCFYLVHQQAEVFIDGEEVYSLRPSPDNRIGACNSNWVSLPILEEDHGKEIVVLLTPLFDSTADFEPEFLIGSHYCIVLEQVSRDFVQLFISLLCILLGLFVVIVQGYFIAKIRSKNWGILLLGVLSILLGLWRITDVKSAPLLSPQNAMLLSYISIGSLYLCSVTLLIYASTFFSRTKSIPLLIVIATEIAVSFAVLMLQVFGIADFKETLPICHVLLVTTILSIPLIAICQHKKNEYRSLYKSQRAFLLLVFGVLLDMILFYVLQSSADIICTPIAFVIYTLVVFIRNSLDTTRKAYVDTQTGLVNKARWTELMQDPNPLDELTVLFMIDLNNLKKVNDSLGHEAGDEMIYNFARILYTTFSSKCVICRWGGDEFTILAAGKDAARADVYLSNLRQSVDRHNQHDSKLPLSYAIGRASSAEFPRMTRVELLAEADRRMYSDKHPGEER